MTPSKQPTNAEILTEIKGVKAVQNIQSRDIDILKEWKRQEDAYRAALKAVKDDEKEERRDAQEAELKSSMIKTLKELSPILTAGALLLYALVEGMAK